MSGPDLFSVARSAPSPMATQRARVPVADGGRDHTCAVCGADAGFGFGVFLRRGREGRWSCMAHRGQVEAMTKADPA